MLRHGEQSTRGLEAAQASTPRLALVCGLMLLLIGLMILMPETPGARSLSTVVTAGGLIAAVSAAGVGRRFVRSVALVAGGAAGVSIIAVAAGSPGSVMAYLVVLTLLVVAVPAAIIGGLRGVRTVSIQTVFGAISIYLVIGLVFALVMTIAAHLSSEPYFAQGSDGTLSQRVYFSYVTLATLGYGDLTPATGLGRLLAVSETVVGNLYLVTAVSLVVSRIGAARPSRRDPAQHT